MVQYRDLNAPPSRMLADVVADMKAQERQSKTGDAGVKDLGETGDIIWPRWDGGEESVREVGENVEAARASIAELNDVILPELSTSWTRLARTCSRSSTPRTPALTTSSWTVAGRATSPRTRSTSRQRRALVRATSGSVL